VVVLLVGTNNFNCTAEQIAEGIMELVRVIREKQPEAYIVLPVNLLFYLLLSDAPS
jgi:platelet-activating factor acetylhydrolase IB subunit beta/gamma